MAQVYDRLEVHMSTKAIFFDSGHTLMRPIGGRWFPGVRFFEICRAHGCPVLDDEALKDACDLGYSYLDSHHGEVPDEEAEERQFAEYYRLIFGSLQLKAPELLITDLSRSAVKDINFEPYPEAGPVLSELEQRGMPMAILTDAWPSTRSKYEAIGFLRYFSEFVISAEQRCLKPDMGMFRPALDSLSVSPGEVLFVDDAPELIAAAREKGFEALLMDRACEHPGCADRVTDLWGVVDHLYG